MQSAISDDKLRALSRLMLGGLLGKYGHSVMVDCASDELLESVADASHIEPREVC